MVGVKLAVKISRRVRFCNRSARGTKLDAIDLTVAPKLYPIHISKGAMGNGLPERDLGSCPQYRVLVSSKIIKRMFEADEVLDPVKKTG